MIIDCHTHAFPPTIRNDRAPYFKGEPAFQLLYSAPGAKLAGVSDIIAMMDDNGVDKSVVFGFPWRTQATFRLNNDYIIDAIQRYPDRLVGFCCMDPMHPAAPGEVERCVAAGLSGAGELAFYTSGIDTQCLDALDPIMAICRQRDLPVMIHTNEPVGHAYPGKTRNTLPQIYALAKRFPSNKLILAHWGGGIFFYALLKKEVTETLANVWFDTAASPFLYRPDIYRVAISLAGRDKVMFGTDFPLLRPRRYFKEMALAELTSEEKARVCGKNAAALLNIGG